MTITIDKLNNAGQSNEMLLHLRLVHLMDEAQYYTSKGIRGNALHVELEEDAEHRGVTAAGDLEEALVWISKGKCGGQGAHFRCDCIERVHTLAGPISLDGIETAQRTKTEEVI